MNNEKRKHTPGKWWWGDVGNGLSVGSVVEGEGSRYVASVPRGPHSKQDATLIAAAPDLLAALRELSEFRIGFAMSADYRGSPLERAVKAALAALAKAEGKS